MAHIACPPLLTAFSTTKAFRLPYCPSAVLIFICIFFISCESTFSVVSSRLFGSSSSFILFSLHTLSLMFSMSTDWLLWRRIVSIGRWEVIVRSYAACYDIRFSLKSALKPCYWREAWSGAVATPVVEIIAASDWAAASRSLAPAAPAAAVFLAGNCFFYYFWICSWTFCSSMLAFCSSLLISVWSKASLAVFSYLT